MSKTTWRVLSAPSGDGAWQMAVDEAVLEAVRLGEAPPTVRFYQWAPHALSLGYAQKLDGLDLAACEAEGLELVRRPTGGRAVLHHGDLTYMIAARGLPAGVGPSYRYLAAALAAGLSRLGLESQLVAGAAGQGRSPACFASATAADLCVLGRKLIGSAQTRRGDTVLQHGAIYLEYPRALAARVVPDAADKPIDLATALGEAPTAEAVQQALLEGFETYLGGTWEPGGLTAFERERAEARKAEFQVWAPSGISG